MSTLYGSANYGGSGNWDDLLDQWWTDTFGGTPSLSTPINGDTVFTDGTFSNGPSVAVVLAEYDNLYAVSSDVMDYTNVSIQASGSVNFTNGTWISNLPSASTGSFTSATCSGSISGSTVTFDGGSMLNGGASGGSTINFTNASYNYSTSFSCTFSFNDSYNNGTLSNCVILFTDSSNNLGELGFYSSKVSWDSTSLDFAINNAGYYTDGTRTSVMSYDNGTTWLMGDALMPAPNKVLVGTNTYNNLGNAVAGTAVVSAVQRAFTFIV
jgi:hypothetical protein